MVTYYVRFEGGGWYAGCLLARKESGFWEGYLKMDLADGLTWFIIEISNENFAALLHEFGNLKQHHRISLDSILCFPVHGLENTLGFGQCTKI